MIVQSNPLAATDAGVPQVYGYRRRSRLENEQPEFRLESQAVLIRDYYETHLRLRGFGWGGDFPDDTDSSRTTMFTKRTAGKALDSRVRRGDVIVIASMSLAFRSMMEFARVMLNWRVRGVGVAIIGQGFETWNPEHAASHRAFFDGLAVYRESQAAQFSTSTREAMQERKRQGYLIGGRFPPPGKRRFGKRLIDDRYDRQVCRIIVELRENGGSIYQIFAHLRRHGIRRTDGRDWTIDMIGRAYRVEKQRQHLEQP